jgi:hypothetical protein
MGLISVVAMWGWLLLAQWSHTMPIFGQQLAESLAYDSKSDDSKSEPKLMTLAVKKPNLLPPASRPFRILLVGLISGVAIRCWLLLAHWSHPTPIFGLQLAESLAYYDSRSEPKLMTLVVKKPNLLPPDHSGSSLWV